MRPVCTIPGVGLLTLVELEGLARPTVSYLWAREREGRRTYPGHTQMQYTLEVLAVLELLEISLEALVSSASSFLGSPRPKCHTIAERHRRRKQTQTLPSNRRLEAFPLQ